MAGAILLVLIFVIVRPPHAADAALPTCGSQTAHFSGRGYDPSGYRPRGAEAEIDVNAGALCAGGSGPATFFTSWVMLGSGGNGYAQVGHMFKNFGSNNHRFFWEYDRTGSGSFTRVFWGNPVFGNHHNFRASRHTSDGHIHFTVEGNNPPAGAETNFDPLQQWSNIIAWWSSEVAHTGSDVPGTPTNKANYQFVHHKNTNETWQLQNWNLNATPSPCYFKENEVTSDSHFRSWTSSPNHTC